MMDEPQRQNCASHLRKFKYPPPKKKKKQKKKTKKKKAILERKNNDINGNIFSFRFGRVIRSS